MAKDLTITDVRGVAASRAAQLATIGIETPAALAAADMARLTSITGISPRIALALKSAASSLLAEARAAAEPYVIDIPEDLPPAEEAGDAAVALGRKGKKDKDKKAKKDKGADKKKDKKKGDDAAEKGKKKHKGDEADGEKGKKKHKDDEADGEKKAKKAGKTDKKKDKKKNKKKKK